MINTSSRIIWIDIAKGVTITLVVFMHVSILMETILDTSALLNLFNSVLAKVRMPLFLFTSGVLTSFMRDRPVGTYAIRRIIPLTWTLVVWTVIGSLFNAYLTTLYPQSPNGNLAGIEDVLTRRQGNMWFVHALLVMSIMYLMLRKRTTFTIIFFIIANIVILDFADVGHWHRVVRFMPFFLIGAFFTKPIIWLVEFAPYRTMAAFGSLFAISGITLEYFDVKFEILFFIVSMFGIIGGSAAARLAGANRHVTSLCSMLGQNSLAIFLGHQFIIALLYPTVLKHLSGYVSIIPATIIVTSVAVIGSISFHRIATRTVVLGWLYNPPIEVMHQALKNRLARG